MNQTDARIDREKRELTISRIFDAPRESVWRAYVEPEQLVEFFAPVGLSIPLDRLTMDVRVGGAFEFTMIDDTDGTEYPNKGTVVEVVEPERLAFEEPEIGLLTTITLTDLGDGRTEITVHQTNVPDPYLTDEALAGFSSSFDRLAAHLASP